MKINQSTKLICRNQALNEPQWKPLVLRCQTKNQRSHAYPQTAWVKLHIPATWSQFGRPADMPSGDQSIEGWHNRFQNLIKKTSKELAIDIAVDLLYKEFDALYTKLQATPNTSTSNKYCHTTRTCRSKHQHYSASVVAIVRRPTRSAFSAYASLAVFCKTKSVTLRRTIWRSVS